jgi:membrane-associated protease RseP (regulator of RpoE activity)
MNQPGLKRKLFSALAMASVLALVAGALWIAGSGPSQAGGLSDVYYFSDDGEDVAYLGVHLREETEHPEGGAQVTGVADDSPADEAGIREGDIIQLFDGRVIRGPVGLTEQIHSKKPGDVVSITLLRDGREKVLEVELGQRSTVWGLGSGRAFVLPEESEKWEKYGEKWKKWGEKWGDWAEKLEDLGGGRGFYSSPGVFALVAGKPKLGVQLTETTPELREHLGGSEDAGVLVSKILPGTPAEKAGIQVGDLIVAIDGEQVVDASEIVRELRNKDGETFPVEVIRDGRSRTIEVTIPEQEPDIPTGPRAFFLPQPPAAPEVPALVPMGELPPLPALPALPELPAPLDLETLPRLKQLLLAPAPAPPPSLAVPAVPAPPAPPAPRNRELTHV